MNKQLSVQPLSPQNAVEATLIYRRSVARNPKGFRQDTNNEPDLLKLADKWHSKGGSLITLQLDQQVVGIGGLHPQSAQVAELAKLHVDKDFQGQGLGRLLAAHLLSLAETGGFKKVVLHVTTTQLAAIRLYESLGFKVRRRQTYSLTANDSLQVFDTLHISRPATVDQTVGAL